MSAEPRSGEELVSLRSLAASLLLVSPAWVALPRRAPWKGARAERNLVSRRGRFGQRSPDSQSTMVGADITEMEAFRSECRSAQSTFYAGSSLSNGQNGSSTNGAGPFRSVRSAASDFEQGTRDGSLKIRLVRVPAVLVHRRFARAYNARGTMRPRPRGERRQQAYVRGHLACMNPGKRVPRQREYKQERAHVNNQGPCRAIAEPTMRPFAPQSRFSQAIQGAEGRWHRNLPTRSRAGVLSRSVQTILAVSSRKRRHAGLRTARQYLQRAGVRSQPLDSAR